MPTLATVAGMAILIYYADHEPPHFHVRAPNFRAKVAIADLNVIEVVSRMRPRRLTPSGLGLANTELRCVRIGNAHSGWSRCAKSRINKYAAQDHGRGRKIGLHGRNRLGRWIEQQSKLRRLSRSRRVQVYAGS